MEQKVRIAIVKNIPLETVAGCLRNYRDKFCGIMKDFIGKEIRVTPYISYSTKRTIPNWFIQLDNVGFAYHKSWLTFKGEK